MLGDESLGHFGPHPAGGKGDGSDTFGPVRLGHRFCQIDKRGLGGAIGHGVRGIAALSGTGRHVDDAPATLRAKVQDGRAGQIHGRQEIYPHFAVPDGLPIGQISRHRHLGADTCVVHESGDLPLGRYRGIKERSGRGRIGQVSRQTGALAANRFQQSLCRSPIAAIVNHHAGAFSSKAGADRLPNRPGCPGHEDGLVLQGH